MISEDCNRIFNEVIENYHSYNDIEYPPVNPYPGGSFEWLLFAKCWIDTVQWHMEDEIRNPAIEPENAVLWKRRIDKSNQDRTDIVEEIDDYFVEQFANVKPLALARLNTESPAGAIDRLSILALKIFHMQEETSRPDLGEPKLLDRRQKLSVLLQQQQDLSIAIDELVDDIQNGRKLMKVYRQMKMYNDPELNPVLYNSKNK